MKHNENLDTPVYLPSHLESLKEKHVYFEESDLETKILRHGNPHYWLQQDILQIKQFQYRFQIPDFNTTYKNLFTLFIKISQI